MTHQTLVNLGALAFLFLLGFLMIYGPGLMLSITINWEDLMAEFPNEDAMDFRHTYKRVTAVIDRAECDRCFTVKINPDGFLVEYGPPFYKAIFIPWEKVREVVVDPPGKVYWIQKTCVFVVDYAQTLKFVVPESAFDAGKEFLPELASRARLPKDMWQNGSGTS